MLRASAVIVLASLVIALVPFALLTEQAEATVACCQINSNGTPRAAGSFRCNLSGVETRRVAVGQYEVDFSAVSTDIRNYSRSAVLDTQTIGSTVGEITVADRVGDFSSVFVATFSSAGLFADRAFDICIH
jgi:hypothetical protein